MEVPLISSKKILKTDIAKVQAALAGMEANETCEVSPCDFVGAICDQIKGAAADKRQSFDAMSKHIGNEDVAISFQALHTHDKAISRAKVGGVSRAKIPARE